MPLTFPTMAEQAEQKFRSSEKTVSLSVIAIKLGGEREHSIWPGTTRRFIFPDDTTLIASGTGKNLKIETFLP